MKVKKFFFNQYFFLAVILALGLFARLYKLDSAVADWHSWRQADTAAVARSFYQEGFNPLIPKYDDMNAYSEPPIFNPDRYRFVEFPIYNTLVYITYLLNGGVSITLARLVSALVSLGSVVFLFLIVRRYWGKATALLSALLLALLPFNVYFSRVVLPEPTLVFLSLGMFYFTDRWIEENSRKLFFVSLFFTMGAFLIKPMAAFYLLPLIYTYYKKEGRIWPVPKRYWLWGVPAILPFLGWRLWMDKFPEGIPASDWLFNGNGIRFKPAFWQWILGERLGGEILTVPGIILFFIGLLKKTEKGFVLQLLALSAFLYLIVFATGNVQHDYYQTLIVPALVIFVARGAVLLFEGIPGFVPRFWTIPMAVLFFVLTFYFGWGQVKGFYQINNDSIVVAGEAANNILPKEAKVIAPWGGDTSFLYYVDRPGFAVVALPIPQMVSKFGITDYISVNYDDQTNWVMRHYTVLEKTPQFVIVDLTKPIPTANWLTDREP